MLSKVSASAISFVQASKNLNSKLHQYLDQFILLFAGACSVLGFAPFALMPITLLSYSILYMLPKANCFSFFFAQAVAGCYWLFFSIKNYGSLPFIPALLITTLALILIASIPTLLKFVLKPNDRPIRFALWITLSEIIRSKYLFSGFPWLLLGHTQLHNFSFKWVPVIGVFGCSSFIALMLACTINSFRKRQRWLLMPLGLWLLGCVFLPSTWTRPSSKQIKFIAKTASAWQEPKLVDLTHSDTKVDLVIWPEGLMRHLLSASELEKLAQDNQAHLTIFGGITQNQQQLFNSTIAIHADATISMHQKYNLVAFGEYWPGKGLYNKIFSTPSDLSPAQIGNQKLIRLHDTFILPIICYDIAFNNWLMPEVVNAGFFVSMHQMHWFDSALATAEQLEFAKARTLEFGRPQVFIEPDYGHVVIKPNGKINKDNIITPYTGLTPFARMLLYFNKINAKL